MAREKVPFDNLISELFLSGVCDRLQVGICWLDFAAMLNRGLCPKASGFKVACVMCHSSFGAGKGCEMP